MGERRFAEDLLNDRAGMAADALKSSTSERGSGAQANTLHIDFRDGRLARFIPWHQFVDGQWEDVGDHERLQLIFGMRIVTIEGFNLKRLVDDINEGRLKSVRELMTKLAEMRIAGLKTDGSAPEPIVMRVKTEPSFDEIVAALRGEFLKEEEKRGKRDAKQAQR